MAKKTPLGLLVRTVRDGDYFHINAFVVLLDGANKFLNPSDGLFAEPINGYQTLANLTVTSQGNVSHGWRERGLYAHEVTFRDVFEVDLPRAKRMAQTLGRFEKKMAQMYTDRGMAKTFGEFLGRVSEALGAETIIEIVREGGIYRDGEYRQHDRSAGIAYVNRLEQAWKDEGRPVEEPA